MIQFFAIFGKGGLVLWCFNGGSAFLEEAVNTFLRNVIVQERSIAAYSHEGQTIKYRLDNEFDIIVMVLYQSVIQLSYADRLLTEVHLRFRDMYKNVLGNSDAIFIGGPKLFNAFDKEFPMILDSVKLSVINMEPTKPRTFKESDKSKKTVASLMETTGGEKAQKPQQKMAGTKKTVKTEKMPTKKEQQSTEHGTSPKQQRGAADEDEEIVRNRNAFIQRKKGGANKNGGTKNGVADQQSSQLSKKGKQARKWDLTGSQKDVKVLDYSAEPNGGEATGQPMGMTNGGEGAAFFDQNKKFVGTLKGDLPGLDEGEQQIGDSEESESDNENDHGESGAKPKGISASSGGWFSAFKSLVGTKQLARSDIEPAMEKMKEMLITKNVASEPAERICDSVAAKLEGKVIGTFNRVASTVREAMREALVQLLTPKRRVDILRDILDAKAQKRPYVIVFCGVNGVGKSTNLAKITFWLNENGHRVLIAAGDTFRAGAVEQLRTHTHHLNALHPQGAQLFEQGYGKDPASIATAAVQLATERKIDVVLVDTAGRMQDNEPLMRALSKLIHMNKPDLVLFVGEALVGNEAVDQLVKFNQALADNSAVGEQARLIDGIVLTKFDTIDDKVGAAISMTYITGQPIVFVGTGQTYHDLRTLNANAVVNILLK
ncbi:hypothetical protein niasHT_000016 [Heterodera trifolii]|uniref:SRP54-type proteins GTP-binding domain-containing protein n=1 Tax=Heterodera trifolii TaxID=157864 RepID=A0ABD2LNA9_9BILA